jgi:ATP-binding cassette subfamily C protein
MKLLLFFSRRYPVQSLAVLVSLFVAGALEGVGWVTLLPVISLANQESGGTGSPIQMPGGLEARIRLIFEWLGLPMTLGVLSSVLFGVFCAKAVILLISKRQVGYMVAQVATDLRLELLRALLAARWPYFTRQPVGRAANAIATEADRASKAYNNLALTVQMWIMTVIAVGFAFTLSWKLSLGAFVGGVVMWYAMDVLVTMASRAGFKQTVLTKSLLGRLADALVAVKLLKAMGREELVAPLLADDTIRLQRQLRRQVMAKEGLMALQEPFVIGILLVVLFVATRRMGMPVEQVLVLILAFGRALNSANKTQRRWQLAATDASALWSIRELTQAAEQHVEELAGAREPSLARGIELRDICVEYDGRRFLDHANLEIPAGQITAVIGDSGSGKTTLVDLVTGLTHPTAGEVRIDGTELGELDLRRWRRMIGYVPQEMPMLHDSVRINVGLGDPSLTDAMIERALRDAGAWDFVARMPGGLDASVGERGTLLSGGQRARIALARALVHQPQLLILDEATTGVEPEMESALWRTLAALRGRVTIVAISHQPALRGVADKIYRVEGRTAVLLSNGAGPVSAAAGMA